MAMVTPHGYNAFFRFMLDNFADELVLPIKFVSTVIGQHEWKLVTLRSVLNKTWSIEVRKDADGSYKLSNGWKDFVEAHDLEFGYLLVFQYCGRMDFFVTVFDKSTCTKLLHVFDENEDSVKVKVEDEDLKVPMERKYLCRKQQFKVTIGVCNHNKENMRLPTCFLDSNDLLGIPRATLVCSGGSWSVKLCYHQHRNQTYISFSRGWCTFTSKNNLGEGDICIFELLSEHKNGVHFLVTKELDMTRLRDALHVNTSATAAAVNLETGCIPGQETSKSPSTKRPHFEVTIKADHLSGTKRYLHIPTTFSALSYLASKDNVTLMDTDGRSWKTLIYIHRYRSFEYPRLSAGWLKFCFDKKVGIGDVCIFELVSEGKDAKMMVHVHKKQFSESKHRNKSLYDDATDTGNSEPLKKTKGLSNMILRGRKRPSSEHDSEVFENHLTGKKKSKLEGTEKPSFKITLKPCNLAQREYLHIPRAFSISNNLSGICQASLVTDGCWSVRVWHFQNNNHKGVNFGKGWKRFWSENNMKAGDVLTFELATKEEKTMSFSVIKQPSETDKSMHDGVGVNNNYRTLKSNITNPRARFHSKDDKQGPLSKKLIVSQNDEYTKEQKIHGSSSRPQFTVRMKDKNLRNENPYVNIPVALEGLNFLLGTKRLLLANKEGRSWEVKVHHNHPERNASSLRISTGWGSFACDNGLEVGDICNFKLTPMASKRGDTVVVYYKVFKKKQLAPCELQQWTLLSDIW